MKSVLSPKKILAGMLAAVLLITGMPNVAVLRAAAAAYGLRFVDQKTYAESQNTQIVESSSIGIRATLPPDYQFSSPPFAVTETGSATPANDKFDITGDGKYYTLIAKPGSSGQTNPAVESSKSYTLNAIYSAFLKSATGTASKSASGGNPALNFVLDAQVTSSPLAVTQESNITFEAETEESDESDGISTLSLKNIRGTGAFAADFNNLPDRTVSIARDAGGRFFELKLIGDNARRLDLKVYILGLPVGRKIPEGTKFSISFIRETLNELIVTVVSPKKFVEDMVKNIKENPVNPEATGTGRPYIQLKGSDTLESVTQNFDMYSSLHRLNVDAKIAWKWVPNDAAYQNNVEIKQKQGSTTLFVFDIINRPQEDMKGKLVATVSYGGQTSQSVEVPITVYGTGAPPKIIPLEKWTGNPGVTDSGQNPKKESITVLPAKMDVYQGNANYDYYKKEPEGPFKFTLSVNYGASRGVADNMRIQYLGDGGEVELRVDGSPVTYVWGADLPNPGANRSIEITASKQGQVSLQFQFFDAAGNAMTTSWKTWSAYVYDSTPSADGKLELLNLRGYNKDNSIDAKLRELYPDNVIPYGFDPAKNDYAEIIVPNKVEEITFQPRVPTRTGASQDIKVEVGGVTEIVKSDGRTGRIKLDVQVPKTIRVTVTAQSGATNVYTLKVTRGLPNPDSTLASLEAYRSDPAGTDDYIKAQDPFSPTKRDYKISVPYSVEKLRVVALPNNPWATAVIEPAPKSRGILFWQSEKAIELSGRFNPETGKMEDNVTNISVTVTSEEGTTTKYTLEVTRLAPDDDSSLKELKVLDADGNTIPFLRNGTVVEFDTRVKDYVVEIPYSQQKVSIRTNTTSENAVNMMLKYPQVYGGKTDTRNYLGKDLPVEWYAIDVSQSAKPDEKKNLFTFEISATAESKRVTTPAYTIEFTRLPPDTDNSLIDLMLQDQNDVRITENYSFNSEQLTYDFSVPYLTKSIKITPMAASAVATVTVNGSKITPNKNYVTMQLDTGKKSVVTVVVTAENGDVRTYTLNITRSKASAEARLSALTVQGGTLKPLFVPAKTAYSVTLPATQRTYTVTATTVDPYATITIAGKATVSGMPSDTIQPTEAVSKVDVVVTAQDGKTKKTYTITVTCEALIPTNSNADLKSLVVSPADVNPRFRPADIEYEVYVKDDTFSISIEPRTSDKHAKVDVLQGTRSLKDYDGNFSSSLIEDENEFKIVVTASDKTTTKTYYLTVYRGNEEKQGRMQPITAEVIDFAQPSPIIIDISKYSIVAADVFNTLRTEYPDKSIIFEGNDYSLEVNGKDLKRLVPNTEQFDFAVSFKSPEADNIYDVLGEDSRNDGLDPVMVYFRHHGELPAPMKFTIGLGGAYRNSRMYWNYYNEERDRVDYYGNIFTNARGTFSVQLTHMSTYLAAAKGVYGAEDRSGAIALGEVGETTVVGNYGITVTNDKMNPNTGVAGK